MGRFIVILLISLILSGCAATVDVVLTEKLRPTVWLKQGQVAPNDGFLIDDKAMRILAAEISACRER